MRAFLSLVTEPDVVTNELTDVPVSDAGEVLIDVEYSAMNYKDWLVAQPGSRVRRRDQLVLGVEAVGRVRESSDERIVAGTEVIAYGGLIGVGIDGGFAEQLRAPARYVTTLPTSFVFHSRPAIIFGLPGYTAMASILSLERHGLVPDGGEVLVTGATGGVGSLAVTLLARRGYRVVASSGSPAHRDWLLDMGASKVIGRDEIADRPERVLASERWAGAIDCVGASTLTEILRSLRYGAGVAASGLVAGAQLDTNVYPFITRNVALLGVDAVETPIAVRDEVWRELASVVSGGDERLVDKEITLEQVPLGLAAIRDGATRGRWLVRPTL